MLEPTGQDTRTFSSNRLVLRCGEAEKRFSPSPEKGEKEGRGDGVKNEAGIVINIGGAEFRKTEGD